MPRVHTTAIIAAAGTGDRMGLETPKQFLEMAGRRVVDYSIDVMSRCDAVDAVILVLPKERPDLDLTGRVDAVTDGAETRHRSVCEGMMCLPEATEVVVVHDAARPLVSSELVARVVDGVEPPYVGAVAAVRLEDALKEVSWEGEVLSHVRRESMWRSQTPQAFRRTVLEDAIARADAEGVVADDCSEIVVRAGYRVKVVEGDPRNLKITTRGDLSLAELLLREAKR